MSGLRSDMSGIERSSPRPIIGVFDSGFGGLTVLRALLSTVTGAHFLYIGDTARLPYGAKSRATVSRYAVESARLLESRGANLLVIACNTATALALDDIRAAVRVPVLGVIEPGAQATAAAIRLAQPTIPGAPSSRAALSRAKAAIAQSAIENPEQPPLPPSVLVLATAATVQSHAYRAACATLGLNATEKACPLLVPLVEEGWTDHPVTREVIRIYLREGLATCTPRAVLLGCTHYPLIHAAIEAEVRALYSHAIVIDSAQATADAVAATLASTPIAAQLTPAPSTFTCFATDSVEKFQRLGSHFLDQPIEQVHLLDLGG
ncbi:MAG TPA: aspartate/glutamate racemase family protein [Acidobacteriaceae bacterium]|nr:aspartate/glutamate racemase family protein [Acidobacteriaceae bacterium]